MAPNAQTQSEGSQNRQHEQTSNPRSTAGPSSHSSNSSKFLPNAPEQASLRTPAERSFVEPSHGPSSPVSARSARTLPAICSTSSTVAMVDIVCVFTPQRGEELPPNLEDGVKDPRSS